MASVITASNFSVDTLNFGKHKPNVNGGYNIEITIGNNNSEETLIQTPKMRAPFGISPDKTNPFKKSLDISFQGFEGNQSMQSFRKMVEKVDAFAIEYAIKNCNTFFKKTLSREIINDYYSSGIKISKKEQYADTFRFKILFLKPNPDKNMPNGKYITSFWNVKGGEENDMYLDKGDSVKALIKPQSLWVSNKSFGITWVCTQVCVHKQQKISGFAFKKTGDSDDEADEIISSEEETEEVEVEVDEE